MNGRYFRDQQKSGDDDREPWHWDKRIPVLTLIALAIQFAGFVWGASSINSRVSEVEQKLVSFQEHPTKLASLEATRDGTTRRLDRIEGKLDRIIEFWGQGKTR